MEVQGTPTNSQLQSKVVTLNNVSKSFSNGTIALKDLTFDVKRGDFVSLLGPSGCGKSTILRIISGLSNPTNGEVLWSAADSYNQKSNSNTNLHEMSFVFQEPTLMPWLTAFGNVFMPLKIKGISKQQAKQEVMEALTLVGLEKFSENYPRELSGGMKMRVSIARALVTKPKLLLMDEPFAALDEITRFKINNDLLNLWEKFGWTVVFVTHSVFESVYLSNRVIVISSRPGRVIADLPITEKYPRSNSYRTSTEYNNYCKQVSETLHMTIGGADQL